MRSEAAGDTEHNRLWNLINEVPYKAKVLENSEVFRPIGTINGYACNVKSLVGPSFALLGNAAEFLDPVFSSGVTIAFKSASLAVPLIDRTLQGRAGRLGAASSSRSFTSASRRSAHASRPGTTAALQRIIFNRPDGMKDVTRQLTSVLAGYAWDRENMFVREPRRSLRIVDGLCAR